MYFDERLTPNFFRGKGNSYIKRDIIKAYMVYLLFLGKLLNLNINNGNIAIAIKGEAENPLWFVYVC